MPNLLSLPLTRGTGCLLQHSYQVMVSEVSQLGDVADGGHEQLTESLEFNQKVPQAVSLGNVKQGGGGAWHDARSAGPVHYNTRGQHDGQNHEP
jgi:hypothetical protein